MRPPDRGARSGPWRAVRIHERADLVVDGAPQRPHDPATELVVADRR